MSSIQQNIQSIRRLLGSPAQGAPADPIILQQLIDSLMHHHSELTSTAAHWNVFHQTLTTSQGQEDYQITMPNFGRPFLVYTKDDSDPFHVRVEIPFSLLQNVDRQYEGPQQSFSTSEHSVALISFYRTNGNWWARFTPTPNASGDFEVWYDQNYEYTGPADAPGIESFHHLVRAHCALSLLPHTEWPGITILGQLPQWNAKIGALRNVLQGNFALYQKQFNEYRAQMTREGVTSKLPWGWRSEDDEWGGGRMVNGIGF